MKTFLLFLFLYFPVCIYSQPYTDYLGAGHSTGVTVTASHQEARLNWNEVARANHTVNGQGLDARLLETSRFLAQATFGTDLNYIKSVSENTFEDWIDNQFTINSPSMGVRTQTIYDKALSKFVANGGNEDDYFGPYWPHFQYAWWESNIGNNDLLRQKVALALSEIMVISRNSNIGDYGVGLGDYYDVLKDNAFGNFKNLLTDVTLHPMMGFYLSHFNNPKSNPRDNIFPDENFAREIMQLFTIGLYELNTNGSYVLNSTGDRIPTYNNNDIKEFAKIFTGLGAAGAIENPWGVVARFGMDQFLAVKDKPMIVYEAFHEAGEKRLLNGVTVPGGQSGMQDINAAIDNLFNHKNVGPFIALRLIQQLVKSNPSPGYIARVSAAFNNTRGVRGDMKAVIKAILLDEEARSCSGITNPSSGKLIEPMMRYFNVSRQLDLNNENIENWNVGYDFYNASGQAPLAAPSVFNFFTPDYAPNSEFAAARLVAPEFQIHDSATSIAFINQVDSWTFPQYQSILKTWDLEMEGRALDFEALRYYAQDSEVLINQLDKLFTHGQLSKETRQLMRNAIDPIVNGWNADFKYTDLRVKMALYLLLISPDYAILK